MEKYTIEKVENFRTRLTLRGRNKHVVNYRWVNLPHSMPFHEGDDFNIFIEKKLPAETVAYAYKIDGKSFVDLVKKPLTDEQAKHFYDNLSFWDSIRLKQAIVRALLSRGIEPAITATNNLWLLILSDSRNIKTR